MQYDKLSGHHSSHDRSAILNKGEEMKLDYTYYKLQCARCSRKILVEMSLFGIPHHTNPSVVCGECIKRQFPKGYKQEHPEAYKDIKEWLKLE